MMLPKKLQIKADIEEMLSAYFSHDFGKIAKISKKISEDAFDIAYEDTCALEFEADKKKVEAGGGTAHSTHCCLDHGCKYGDDEYCTVMQGIERQEVMCPASTQCDTYGDYNEEYDMHSNYKPY